MCCDRKMNSITRPSISFSVLPCGGFRRSEVKVHPRAGNEGPNGVDGQLHTPAALPLEKTRYPLYRRLGGHQSRPGRVQKISLPPGFDPRTVQPLANRYTD